MMRKIQFPILLLFSLILFSLNCEQLNGGTNYSFKHYNINNGLSQNTVQCILQDDMGFMWFGTKDGLNRFDGTSFKIFRFTSDVILSNNVFNGILQDKQGSIWTATDDGVYIYNPMREDFTRLHHVAENGERLEGYVSDIIADEDGDIWMAVGGKGVFHYSFSFDSIDYYPIPTVMDGVKIISLCVDIDNIVWAFPYSSPFLKIDKKKKKISEFQLEDDKTLLYSTGEISKVMVDQYNQLIIASSQQGVFSVNPINNTHQILLQEDSDGEPVFARCVERIDRNTLWVGTESGLYILDTDTRSVKNIRHDFSVSTSLSDNAIYSIYKDREGGVWIGSYFGGIDYYSEQLNKFELFYPISTQITGARVREFCAGKDGKIWIGTEDNGLNLFDSEKNTFLPLPEKLNSLYKNIHTLYNDGVYLWIGTFSKGLNRYNQFTGELVTYTHSDDPNSIINNHVFSIYRDRQNTLWVGTFSGLCVYDQQEDRFSRIDMLKGLVIHDIYEDSGGSIWVATFSNGLYRFRPSTSEWTNYQYDRDNSKSLSYNSVTSIFEDSKNRLWITTQGGGFCQFNQTDETFTTYNTNNGLSNDVVFQIQEEDANNLWLSTNAGLVKFNTRTGVFRNYTVENGLRTNQFNYKSSFKTANGMLYFGSIEGFVRFNPSTFREQGVVAPIVFTELMINNTTINPNDEKSILKQSILFTDKLTLPYHKNSFRLSYAVLDYSNRSDFQLYYMLNGFDSEWLIPESENDIVYSNLKPGKYVLTMKLINGSESREEDVLKSLAIHIHPPFWQSKLAYLFYVLLFIGGVIALLRYLNFRNLRVQKEKMITFEQEKERELYQSKIDFFTSVAHEIRTPLSLIKAPLDYVLINGDVSEDMSEEVKEHLQIMSKNTDRLLDLINQLLDFQKTESEAYLLNLESQNVSEIIRETFMRFKPLTMQKELNFELDLPQVDMYARVDKEAFLKIISNLISNAIKFCDRYVRLKAYISPVEDEQLFHMITENDGETIPEKYREEIFKPFVHLNNKQDQTLKGTGVGLALSRSLTELHNGTLELDHQSELTRFHLMLPAGNAKEIEIGSSKDPKKCIKKDLASKSSPYTILLVDDDQELLQFEKKILSPHYNVLTAENGVEAVSVLRESNVNLVVCDIMMPKMDGYEFTKYVKSDIEFSHIPVILLTAKVNVEAKVLGFETGADAYIDKPFSLEVLMAQIANLLQNREKLRETFLKYPYIGAVSMGLTKSDEEFIEKLYTIVNDNLGNSEFVVEDIAEQFNMSRASFYRKIKGVLDLTPNEYIRAERLKKAAQLLKEKKYKVNEVCYMVGFNSPSYFTKCFQQQFGVLPRDFE